MNVELLVANITVTLTVGAMKRKLCLVRGTQLYWTRLKDLAH